MMATCVGFSRDDFWETEEKRKTRFRKCPYDFNDIMSRRRFQLILKHLSFTTFEPPNYRDDFFKIRQMITEWNRNMSEVFIAAWVCCLDESMSPWTNRWTCPGWVFCPRKPYPFGNEYHTMCCALSAIMFVIDLVEGKQRPKELPSRDPNRFGNTVSLLLRMTNTIVGSGKVIILDSGFCVLKGITELMKRGIYAGALIKKRRYWPKFIKGDAMDAHMSTKATGETACLTGMMDNVKYYVFAMKEPDYTSKIMASYGNMLSDPGWEERSRREHGGGKKHFKYILPFQNHFKFRHSVDDHNNHRHQVPSWEGTFKTIVWENRVFTFVVAISEVNAWLAFRFFVWILINAPQAITLLDFRIELATQLVNNPYRMIDDIDVVDLTDDCVPQDAPTSRRSARRLAEMDHKLESAPKKARKYLAGKWTLDDKKDYQAKTCTTKGCSVTVRTYCICNVGHWLCHECYAEHRVGLVMNTEAVYLGEITFPFRCTGMGVASVCNFFSTTAQRSGVFAK